MAAKGDVNGVMAAHIRVRDAVWAGMVCASWCVTLGLTGSVCIVPQWVSCGVGSASSEQCRWKGLCWFKMPDPGQALRIGILKVLYGN